MNLNLNGTPIQVVLSKEITDKKIFLDVRMDLKLTELFDLINQQIKLEGQSSEYVFVTHKIFEITPQATVQSILPLNRDIFIIGILKKTELAEINKIKPFYHAILQASSILTEEQRHLINSLNHLRQIITFYDEDCLGKLMDALPMDNLLSDDPEENLTAITKWFKEEYFTFVSNEIPCHVCGNKAVLRGTGPPTRYEHDGYARAVDIFRCPVCEAVTRFPRYDSPTRLLETRKGRCMEFANVFTGMLLSFGFDARIVLDTTDHVWTEVWLDSKQRYVHVDPCENIIDAPYTYEEGWKKKLEWVIAFGRNEVYDVTPRYTRHLDACIERRSLKVDEEFYHKIVEYRNQQYQSKISDQEKEEIKKRNELDIESMKEHRTDTKAEEQRPRISGNN